MKKLLTLLAVFLMAVAGAYADNITADEAQQLAQNFLSNKSGARRVMTTAGTTPKLTLQATLADCYVFSRAANAGYVIVASDDAAPQPILGYADTGSIDTGNMPCNLRWMLEEYGRELAWARQQPAAATTAPSLLKAATTTRTDIAPLVQSHWSQSAPYNALCPTENGQHSVTGCVATAVAQIMRYHCHPAKGTGSKSYSWNGQTLSRDFTESTYDWDNMLLDYGSSYTTAQEQAVARLMVDVGYGVEMEYSTSASGTYSQKVPTALTSYFGYSSTTREVYRSSYGLTAWMNLLYNELKNRRPVYISGANDEGGHAFVLDGYRDGYFHINWGWGGMSDGYFLISALDPSTQGIGGSSAGYNSQQDAIIGIEPGDGSTTPVAAAPTIYLESFTAYASSLRRSGNFNFGDMGSNIYNLGSEDATGYVGLKVVSESGATTYLACESQAQIPAGYGIYGTDVDVPLSDFPTDQTQTYKVYPAFKSTADGQWYDMFVYNSTVSALTATTDQTNVYFSNTAAAAVTLTATDITLPTKVFAGKTFTLQAHISAKGGEYNDKVYVYSGTSQIGSASVNVDDETSINVAFSCTAPSTTGTYSLTLRDKDGNTLADAVSYTVERAPSGTTEFSVSNVEFVSTTPNDLHLRTTFTCTGGYYDGQVYAAIFEDGAQTNTSMLTSSLTTWSGESTTVDFQGAFSGTVGKRYFILHYIRSSSSFDLVDNDYHYFTLNENAVNPDPEPDPDPEPEPDPVKEYASILALVDSAYTSFAAAGNTVSATSRPSLEDVQLNFAADTNQATVLTVLTRQDTSDGQPTGVEAGAVFVSDQSGRGIMLTTATQAYDLTPLQAGDRLTGHLVGSYKEVNGLPAFEVKDSIEGAATKLSVSQPQQESIPVTTVDSVGTLAKTNLTDADGNPNAGDVTRQAYGPYLNTIISLPGTIRSHDGAYYLVGSDTDSVADATLSRISFTTDEVSGHDLSAYEGVSGTFVGLLLKRNVSEAKLSVISDSFFSPSRVRLSETDDAQRVSRMAAAGLLGNGLDIYVHRTALATADSAYTTICLPFSLTADEFAEAFGCDIAMLAEATEKVSDDGVHQFRSIATKQIEAGTPYLLQTTGTQTQGHSTTAGDDNYWTYIGKKQLTATEPAAVTATYGHPAVGGEYRFYGTYGQQEGPADGGSQKYQYVSADNAMLRYLPATSEDTFPGLRAYFHFPSWDATANTDDRQDCVDYIVRIAVDGQQTNAISSLTLSNGSTRKPIYNLSGQLVGTSRDRLAKGVYVQDGKKFVVK